MSTLLAARTWADRSRALHFRDLLYGRSRDRARTASSTARDRQLLVQPSERARARARHGRVCSSLAPQLLPVRLSARAQAAARAAAHAPWHRAACHCAAAVAYSLSQTRSRPRCCSGALASSMRLPIARLPPPRRAAATGVRAAAARRRRARAAASRSARAKLLVLEEELPRAVLEQEQELRAAARSRAGDSGVICTCSKGGGVPARARPSEPDRLRWRWAGLVQDQLGHDYIPLMLGQKSVAAKQGTMGALRASSHL